MKQHLLITGIPGTGKTSIGNHLANNYKFIHINREQYLNLPVDFQERIKFYKNLIKEEKVVITWGFMPGYDDLEILEIQKLGFKMFWLDGNREAARLAFIKRGDVSEDLLNIQMDRINSGIVKNLFNPIELNPFNNDGNFLDKDMIIQKLIKG